MTEKDKRWNHFIQDICSKAPASLSKVQKTAVLCFWYDAEMNSGGHSGYFDCYPETIPQELMAALATVGYQKIADNYQKALTCGEADDWAETDAAYYDFSPSLCDCLRAYVEANQAQIFDPT